jgi:hypothetical protein
MGSSRNSTWSRRTRFPSNQAGPQQGLRGVEQDLLHTTTAEKILYCRDAVQEIDRLFGAQSAPEKIL